MPLCTTINDCIGQWRSQDTEVSRAQGLHATRGSTQRRVAPIIPRKPQQKSFTFIFSYQDGLSWHLGTSHCKQPMLSKVSWRAWQCDLPQAARLELNQSIIQDLMEWNHGK